MCFKRPEPRSFCFLSSFRLSYRVADGTCAFAEASPKTKNPHGTSPYLFGQCSAAAHLSGNTAIGQKENEEAITFP
jgi:hypothetical protein